MPDMNRLSTTSLFIMGLALPVLSAQAFAQTSIAPPVSPQVAPTQSTPEVIVPPRTLDSGALVAPPAGPAADPNTIVPGQTGLGLTETDARRALDAAGYSGVSGLTRESDGVWAGTASKGGHQQKVKIDRRGQVSAG
jgi:hypothetical protein